jgi:SAM-dependent methyltransferase
MPIAIKRFLKKVLPFPAQKVLFDIQRLYLAGRYRMLGRKTTRMETSKARGRRVREGFFERYCRGIGLDIGYGGDLLAPNCRPWDIEHGDALHLRPLKDASFDFIYSSHTLEHMSDPSAALKNWWRVLKPGGYLILYIPHRDLYEKKWGLPSRWNPDHKFYFLVDEDDPPVTLGIVPLIRRSLSEAKIVYAQICREGFTLTDPDVHSDGEYSIEVVAHKNPQPVAIGTKKTPNDLGDPGRTGTPVADETEGRDPALPSDIGISI